ncbi:PREDICTED: protein NETWORKED 3A [Tarenaya hassleriana]|uniref:protein NETWORKED 3A n=1 Tax=Tarenaya hassleriana TaxID=28532 RepID=UPI00053C47C1|nr:PREDICTED: protein NETWORKED 3A [Tarenaya hassleriana]XP_010522660.1 PREDICTED: protein NETWORKED 3A [Tarenaya hassleriana]
MENGTSKWWWIGNHNTSDLSPWLRSTLSELDAKTKAMLRVIEEDADSFAERAEMYYKRRPELISRVEDLYRTYRSLAEKYDLARPPHKHPPPEKSPHAPDTPKEPAGDEEEESSWTVHAPETPEKSTCKNGAWSYASEIEEYAQSEVDDGEGETDDESSVDDEDDDSDGDEMTKMEEEVERLRDENRVSKELMRQKDEEKREAIRQLSLAVEVLKEENSELKKRVSAAAKQKEASPWRQLWGPFEFKKLKEGFLGRRQQLGF